MKLPVFVISILMILASCSKDDDSEVPPHRLQHVGQRWKISSVEYNIVDQGFSNPMKWVKNGTAANAGYFYFNGSEGSFDILIDNEREEDVFGYTIDGSSVTIITIDQHISVSNFSQSIIAFNGEQHENTMTISGTFTKQANTSQYVFTGGFVLTRE